jgi:hypothetical protein
MGLTSLYEKKQQPILSFMRSVLFCSESHLAKKSLLAEREQKREKLHVSARLHHPHTNEHGQYIDGPFQLATVPELRLARPRMSGMDCQDWRIQRVCVSLPV